MEDRIENQSIGCDIMLQEWVEENHIYRQITVTKGSRGEQVLCTMRQVVVS